MRFSSLMKAFLAVPLLIGLAGCGDSKKPAAAPAAKAPPSEGAAKKADERIVAPAPSTHGADPIASSPAAPPLTGSAPAPAALPAPVSVPQAVQPTKPAQPLNVSYVGPDFYAALVLHPRRLAQSPLIAPLLKEPTIAAAMQQWEIAPADVEQLLLLAAVPPKSKTANVPESPTFVVRFTKAMDLKKLLVKFQAMMAQGAPDQLAETTCAGKPCYQFPAAPWFLAHAADPRTLVIANEKDMKAVLTAGEGRGPLADRLRQADGDSDLVLAVSLDSIRELVKEGVEQAKKSPSLMSAFADIPMLLSGATLTLDLTGNVFARAVLDGGDAPSADKVETLIGQGLAMAKVGLAMAGKDMPESAKAKLGPALGLADQLLAGVGMTKTAARVAVTLNRPASLDEAFPKLVAMVQESMASARQAARRAQEMNNLRQIAMAMLIHEQSRGTLPPAVLRDSQGKAMWSWRVAMLPYLGEKALFDQLHRDEPWNSPHNLQVARQTPKVFQSADRPNDGKTSVMIFTGPGTAFAGDKRVAMADVKDGAANTILLVEAGPDKAVLWTQPEDLPFDPQNPIPALGQIAPEGFLAAFFDGHVERLKVDGKTLGALITPSGGEKLGAK